MAALTKEQVYKLALNRMKLGLGNALFDSVLSDCRHFFNRLLINHYV